MYRNVSTVPGITPAMRVALEARGIVDYCNALPPRSRKRYVQIFVKADGSTERASTTVLGECTREAAAIERAQRRYVERQS